MDEFDFMYADEMEAMEDFEPPDYEAPASKRSLKFVTPCEKGSEGGPQITPNTSLNTSSELIPMESPSPGKKPSSQPNVGNAKRPLMSPPDNVVEEFLASVSDAESRRQNNSDNVIASPNSVPRVKRPKLTVTSEVEATDTGVLSELILEARHSTKSSHRTETYTEYQDRLMQDYDFDRPRVTFRIPRSNFLGVTGTDGTRVYMKVRNSKSIELESTKVANSARSLHLLGTPFSALMEQIADMKTTRILEEAVKITASINAIQEEISSGTVRSTEGHIDAVGNKENQPSEEVACNLWVDKYTPRGYADLLSDESINRTLLHWLKLWDHVVFNKAIKVKRTEVKQPTGFTYKKKTPQVNNELDKLNRPLQKVVLLNGPPGLGKTTLAHVIAKHAGYNVVEMNASDDRSVEAFKTKLESAIQMKSVIESDPRPNCLVIDEIDGSPQAAINILLNLTKEVQPGKKNKGVLLRPIICICNDLYVPSLRQLRQIALVFTFPPTETARLACRLYQVVKWESLKADMNALMALCEKTDNDIRSCLNTLQFVQSQHRDFNLRVVQSMNIGQKDMQKSLFSVWYDVFRMPRVKKSKYLTVHDLQTMSSNMQPNTTHSARFQHILAVTQASGEFEKIMHGLFQNYLDVKFKDPRMEGINVGLDWLGFVDQVNNYIYSNQEYSLMKYRPYMAVIFHFMFASNTHPKILYPHQNYEMNQKKVRCENLVSTLLSDTHTSVRKYLNFGTVVLEVIQPLINIIQPALRPVNTQLYSNREKESLRQLIRIMIAYNMTYHQEKSFDGQYNYVLDPNVEEVVRFPGMKQQKQLTYATKQLIAREIEVERMRIADKSSAQHVSDPNSSIPNHKQVVTPRPIVQEIRPERDFFGRIIKKVEPDPNSTVVTTVKESNLLAKDIWFHFKEGFSNAVRRNVKIQDFL